MKLKTLLLPPVTIPQDRLFRQLLLVFDEVFLYAASEDGCDDNIYSRNHLLKHYAPLPFGADLPKFQRLIRDISANRAEYYSGGLFSLSAAAAHNENTVWQLVSEIMSPENREDKHAKTLLQVRLILRLAEIATSEEEEISRDLAGINRKVDSLLDDLKDEAAAHPETAHLSTAVAMNLTKLVRAWAYLFLADKAVYRPAIVSTANLEVFEMLADYYSANLGEQPIKLCTLPLPDIFLDNAAESFLDKRREFRKSGSGLSALAAMLNKASLEGIAAGDDGEKIEAAWREMAVPINEAGNRVALSFYLFKGVALPEIFARITRGQADQGDFPPHGIVAVLG
ncbi:MAG: hypothetical protein GXP59_04090 [Deltaproteobacteria bacterium]|nr:hypothetical protein [Deltaproteobacteria bacterium]